jgi:hypothetical protein
MYDKIGTNDALADLILKELHPTWTTKQRLSRRLRCLSHIANLFARALLFSTGASKKLAALQAKPLKGAVDAKMVFWADKGSIGMLHNVVRFIRASPQRIERFTGVLVGGLLEKFDRLHVSSFPKGVYTTDSVESGGSNQLYPDLCSSSISTLLY